MKNTILHPTDFSKCADNAFQYAIVLAKTLQCRLQIVHSLDFDGELNLDQNAQTMLTLSKNVEGDAEKKIKELGVICQKEGVEFEANIYTGKISSWLPEYISNSEPILVVMGTTGASNIANKIFGSNTYAIIKNSNSPVMAIPETVKIKAFSRLVLSTVYKDKDIEAIQFISKLAKPTAAKIDIVHILNKETAKKDNNQTLLDDLKNRVETVETYTNIAYRLLYGENTEERLQILIEENKPDLLVLIMVKRNLFERLFFSSLTEKMVHKTNIPLLVFSAE